MNLYHGGTDIIESPVILSQPAGRDFGIGFYCTNIRDQAEKWAKRQSRIRRQAAIFNCCFFYIDKARRDLKCKLFNEYSLEWLELIIKCRKNHRYIHGFDIVFGKIANDDVGETVQAVLDGLMPMDFALQKLVFMPANNQYCFCTEKALEYLKFEGSDKLE